MQIDNLIIDGTNLEFRIFYITRGLKATSDDNEQTSCMYRFLYTFKTLMEKFNPTNVYAAWDKKLDHNSVNFRKEILVDQYKANRVKPPDIQEMYDQEINLIEMLESVGVKSMFPNALEADDVCAWLSKQLTGKTVIVSVDQDLLQLISPTVSVYNLKELITYENFTTKKNINIEHFLLYKAIKGDSSDNVSGIKGYGEVRARKLAANWTNTNTASELKQLVERNLKIMDLHYGYQFQTGEEESYKQQFEYLKNKTGDFDKFKLLCEKHGFTSYLNNIREWRSIINRNNTFDFISMLT